MDRFTFNKLNIKIKNKILICVCVITSTVYYTSPAFSLNKQRSNLEQQKLAAATSRISNNRLYASNLANVIHPTKNQLYTEAKIKNTRTTKKNYALLKKWYENKLSKSQRKAFEKNCSASLAGFNTYFPMTESTLSCAGVWLENKIEARKTPHKTTRRIARRKIFKLRSKDKYNFYKYRNLSLASSLNNMKTSNFKNVERLAKTALTTKYPCSYKNPNFALIATLEDFLPKKEAYQYISKIYQKSQHCYKPNQNLSERVHLRMGVIYLAHDNQRAAKRALQKTRLERNPQDESRSLYWLGSIAEKETKKANNKYWKTLIQKNPIGFFSLVVNSKLAQNPERDFVPDSKILIQNRVSGGWNEINLQAFLFDLFYTEKDTKAFETHSKLVVNSQVSHKDLNLYWAVSHNIANNDRYSIYKLANYLSAQRAPRLSPTLVKLNFPLRYSKEILRRSKKVDPLLVLALIRQESAFDQFARSHANARGLMQMLPSTARVINKRIQAKKLYDPQTNINLGITYLEQLFERYNGHTEYVLAAYNAGPHRVDAWSKRITVDPLLFMEYVPYKETRNYVSTIMRNYYWYKRIASRDNAGIQAQKLLDRNMSAIWKPTRIATAMK